MTRQVCPLLIQRRCVLSGSETAPHVLVSLMAWALLRAEFYSSVETYTLFSHHGPKHKPPRSSGPRMKEQHVSENLVPVQDAGAQTLCPGSRAQSSCSAGTHSTNERRDMSVQVLISCPTGLSCLNLPLKGFTSLIKFFIFCPTSET